MVDIREELKQNRLRIAYLLAFVFSLTGAILLFAFDFLEWYIYPSTYGWIHTDSEIYGPIIIMAASFLLICTFINIVGIYNPEFIKKQTLLLGLFFSVIVFLMTIIGILIAAGDLDDVTSWNPDAGFYGAIIGSLLTIIFLGMAFIFKKQGSVQGSNVPRQTTPVKTTQKAGYCPKCGKGVSGKFCTSCGTELRKIQENKPLERPNVKYCSKCGKEVIGKFCTYCGTNLR